MCKNKTPKLPLEVFPEYIQELLTLSEKELDLNIDYMTAGYMSAIGAIWGKRIQLRVKNNWIAKPSLWLSIVGDPSSKKTPALNQFFKPVQKISDRLHKEYLAEYSEFNKMPKEQKAQADIPQTKHFVLSNYTTEGLSKTHSQNNVGITVYADEIVGWVNGFGAYKAGKDTSDRQAHLEFFNGGSSNVTRASESASNSVEDAFVGVIGGIQEDKLGAFLNSEYQGDGFAQRILFVYPDNNGSNPIEGNLEDFTLDDFNFEEIITKDVQDYHFDKYKERIQAVIEDKTGKENPIIVGMSEYVSSIREHYSRKITGIASNPEISIYERQFLIKLDTYLPRIALLLELSSRTMGVDIISLHEIDEFISITNMHNAFKLVQYYYLMYKKVNEVHFTNKQVDDVINNKESKKNLILRLLRAMAQGDLEAMTQKEISKRVGCSVRYVKQISGELNI